MWKRGKRSRSKSCDPQPLLRHQGRDGGAGRAAADHDHVGSAGSVAWARRQSRSLHHEPPGLHLEARQRSRRSTACTGVVSPRASRRRGPRPRPAPRRLRPRMQLDLDRQATARRRVRATVVRNSTTSGKLAHDRLDRRRVDVDAADVDHVVARARMPPSRRAQVRPQAHGLGPPHHDVARCGNGSRGSRGGPGSSPPARPACRRPPARRSAWSRTSQTNRLSFRCSAPGDSQHSKLRARPRSARGDR